MRVSKNIQRHELACGCGCGYDSGDFETIRLVQSCCDHFARKLNVSKVVLHINSWCRCFAWNDHEDGGEDSEHLRARACDFWIEGVSPDDVYDYLAKKYPNKYGIGKYKTFTHLDTRTDGPARW